MKNAVHTAAAVHTVTVHAALLHVSFATLQLSACGVLGVMRRVTERYVI